MPENKLNDYGEILFQWRFPEFPRYERDKSWYVWSAVIVALLEVYSIWTFNFLFGLIAIISWLILIMFHRSEAEVDFKIVEDGVVVNGQLFEYKKLKHFYIIYEPPTVKTLYFDPKSIFSPRIPIALQDQDPVQIREVLKKYLDEDIDRENEPTSDQFSRMLKL